MLLAYSNVDSSQRISVLAAAERRTSDSNARSTTESYLRSVTKSSQLVVSATEKVPMFFAISVR